MVACPDPTELVRFALRTLAPDAAVGVQEHVDSCAACRAASSALVTASRGELVETAAWSRPELAVGAQLDRFVILHELGEGAASVVYAAYDPELDRKVALKVLRSRGGAVDEKLLREGRALAKLSHPNVVGVYEVGNANGQFFIALELVEGVTVRQWVVIEPRTWRAIRDVYVAAGRGLAALHRAGLVHRDVKPDNIVVGSDGRARLVDFGLVGAGAGAGTPRYMAPEGSVDARSDVFAFAASLDESLDGAKVPGRVRAAIERATSADPVARHPSVDAMLAELADRPHWHFAVPAALAIGALGAGAAFYVKGDTAAAEVCAPTSVWTADERAGVEVAIDASGRSHAATTKARVVPRLDAIAKAIGAERVAACKAYHEDRVISAERFDRQVACLDRQQRSFAATVATLRSGNAEVIDRAIDLVGALSGAELLADCRDDAVLARSEPLPTAPGAREAVIRVEEELARAEVAQRSGDSPGALVIARRALEAARETAYGPVIARAVYYTADLLEVGGKAGEGRALVEEAIRTAAAARLDAIEAKAWTLQLYILGNAAETKQPEVDAAARAAEAAVVRAREALLRARLENTLGIVKKQRGDYAAARTHYEKALEVLRAIDPDRPEVSSTMSNLATVLRRMGELEPALEMAKQAVQRDRETFGSKHPSYADALVSLASAEIDLGKLDDALAHQKEALAIQVATFGEESSPVMITRNGMSTAYGLSGKLDDADREATVALALAEKLRGPDHPETAQALLTIANIAGERQEFARAAQVARRALAIIDGSYGPEHPFSLSIHANLGIWALGAKDAKTAETELRFALAGLAKMPESPMVASIQTALGSALVDLGKRDEAVRELEAALALREKIRDEPIAIADSQFTLARALWSTKRARALGLARTAFATFAKDPARATPYLPGIRRWLAETKAPLQAPPGEAPGEATGEAK